MRAKVRNACRWIDLRLIGRSRTRLRHSNFCLRRLVVQMYRMMVLAIRVLAMLLFAACACPFQCEAYGLIRGVVVDTDGLPIDMALVECAYWREFESEGQSAIPANELGMRLLMRRRGLTDSCGHFDLPGLPLGGYRIKVSHPSFPTTIGERVTVTSACSTEVGVMRLPHGCKLSGRVSCDESWSGRYRVIVWGDAASESVLTNGDGEFAIDALLPFGDYNVSAERVGLSNPLLAVLDGAASMKRFSLRRPEARADITVPKQPIVSR